MALKSDICDILDLIYTKKRLGGAKEARLRNVEVWGVLKAVTGRPTCLQDSANIHASALSAVIDIFGIQFLNANEPESVQGRGNETKRYMAKGSISTCVPVGANLNIGDVYAFRGNIALGSRLPQTKVLTLFNFRKITGGWMIYPTPVDDVNITGWDENGLDKRILQYLMLTDEKKEVVHPQEMQGMSYGVASSYLDENGEEVAIEVAPVQPESNKIQVVKAQEVKGSLADLVEQKSEEEKEKGTAQGSPSKRKNPYFEEDFEVQTLLTKPEKVEKYEDYCSGLEDAEEKFKSYRDEVIAKYSYEVDEDGDRVDETDYSFVTDLIKRVQKYWSRKPSSAIRGLETGGALIKKFLLTSGKPVTIEVYGSPLLDCIMNSKGTILDYTLGELDEFDIYLYSAQKGGRKKRKKKGSDEELKNINKAYDIVTDLFMFPGKLYCGLIGVITGVGAGVMLDLFDKLDKKGMNLVGLLKDNPFMLSLLEPSMIKFSDAEQLARCLGYNYKETREGIVSRDSCAVYNFLLGDLSGGDTCIKEDELGSKAVGFTLTSLRYNMVKRTGTFLTESQVYNSRYYLDTEQSSFKVDAKIFQRVGASYTERISRDRINEAIINLQNCGLVAKIADLHGRSWITTTQFLHMELYTYNKLVELGQKFEEIKNLDEIIENFENDKGFKLEQRQREAAQLVQFGAAVLTGPAGSGKTTVSELMVKALKDSNEDIRIKYAAPTGKAAKRLQEVVGGSVKTMHSMFAIFNNNVDVFDDADDFVSKNGADVFFFDESAMCTLQLIFLVLSRIPKAKIYFLGDFHQLPPIGKGMPFRNMLMFLPRVELNVTKRSAEGSKVTANSKIINDTDKEWKPLEDGEDFSRVVCSDDMIATKVKEICAHHLGLPVPDRPYFRDTDFDYTPDDIQVITPIANPNHTWGSYNLNLELHDMFNPRVGNLYFLQKKGTRRNKETGELEDVCMEYRFGDRVIHTDNSYGVQHYITYKGGSFQKICNCDVMNGDVGHIVSYIDSTMCTFLEPVEEPDTDEEREEWEKKKEKLRDDEDLVREGTYFCIVEFYDAVKDRKYYCLYPMTKSPQLSIEGTENVFSSYELNSLQLSYALSVHKMQGSQAKIIIFALGTVGFQKFITRNLIYTGVTRAIKLVYMAGNVSDDPNSQLSIGRMDVADDCVNTVTELMIRR